MPLSKRTRYEVLKRDNHTCRYCGATAPDATLTVDHVTPVALGGTDKPDNLVAACKDCNAGKASTSPDAALVEDVAQDAFRWAAAIKRAAEVMAVDTETRWKLNSEFNDLWNEACQGFRGEWYRPGEWTATLDTFRHHGLPQTEIIDSFWVMQGKDHVSDDSRWRYFCGICWRKITAIQQAAIAIIEAE